MAERCSVTINLGGQNGLDRQEAQAYVEHVSMEARVIGEVHGTDSITIKFRCDNFKWDGKCAGKCLKSVLLADGVDVSSVSGCLVES